MGQITVEKNLAGIEGLCIITPLVHGDDRGYFMETYSQCDMEDEGINITFVQDNQSSSSKGVLRPAFSDELSTGKTCTRYKGGCI